MAPCMCTWYLFETRLCLPNSQYAAAVVVAVTIMTVSLQCLTLMLYPPCRRTQQALQMWSTLSRTASTPSTVLPASLVEDLQVRGTHPPSNNTMIPA
jgi:hypothetical protein